MSVAWFSQRLLKRTATRKIRISITLMRITHLLSGRQSHIRTGGIYIDMQRTLTRNGSIGGIICRTRRISPGGVVGSLDLDRLESLDWASSERSDPPQLTGEWEASGYVDAYRLYYANDKQHLYRWSGRERPPWLDEYRVTRTTD